MFSGQDRPKAAAALSSAPEKPAAMRSIPAGRVCSLPAVRHWTAVRAPVSSVTRDRTVVSYIRGSPPNRAMASCWP